ncbi:MarR family transcriptional regulator [Cryobacterium sp. TMT1-66-1]|nr:MarR family transcriptional regulator [Cryobacterium sp. TMT1-66-1]
MTHWTFLTNHAHVLLCVADNPNVWLRDVAVQVGITERAAQRIVTELEEAGYLERERNGRRNLYRLNTAMPLRHPLDRDHRIGELLAFQALRPAGTTGLPQDSKAQAEQVRSIAVDRLGAILWHAPAEVMARLDFTCSYRETALHGEIHSRTLGCPLTVRLTVGGGWWHSSTLAIHRQIRG